MSFARLLLRFVLLLGLVLTGTVPDGMMRQAGPEGGLRLVLCTPDGTKEVWLTEDGETVPVEAASEEGGSHDGGKPHCVQVALASQDAPPPLAEARVLELRPADPAQLPHQVARWRNIEDARRTRAPPVPLV